MKEKKSDDKLLENDGNMLKPSRLEETPTPPRNTFCQQILVLI